MSMPTRPDTSFLAAVTHRLPGPTMTSAAGMGPTPYAMAAMACAPPTQMNPSTPARCAAASVAGAGLGLATQTCSTPATRAVIAVMSTDDGSGYLPPGA